MPYIFTCDICHVQGPNHAGTMQIVLYEWDKESIEKRDLITVCVDCLPRLKNGIGNLYAQLGVEFGGRH